MFGLKQKQKSGENSYNIQAKEVSVGLSYSDARQLAMDVYEGNFHKLSEVAGNIARERAGEFLDAYLYKLQEQIPKTVEEIQNPDMQYAIFTAQKEFARNGEEELGELLVQLLVDRTQETKRGLMQIVLNESLAVAPKLTSEQLDVLSLVFIIKYTKFNSISDLNLLKTHIEKYITPFTTSLNKKRSTYQHLEFASCGNISIGSSKIENVFLKQYPGLFSNGFNKEVEPIPIKVIDLIIPSLHNKEGFQISAIDEEVLGNLLNEKDLTESDRKQVELLFASGRMSEAEVKDYLLTISLNLIELFDVWTNSELGSMTLTSVGIAIAHANIQRKIGEKFDLSIWI